MSQDHIEVFFSAVRSQGGFNNNPSVIVIYDNIPTFANTPLIKNHKNGELFSPGCNKNTFCSRRSCESLGM